LTQEGTKGKNKRITASEERITGGGKKLGQEGREDLARRDLSKGHRRVDATLHGFERGSQDRPPV